MHISKAKALKLLKGTKSPFLSLFEHGSLQVEMYKPEQVDLQTPHDRDEIYAVVDGSGEFVLAGATVSFGPGDFLFVPAGVEHRFINFTDDFATWVFFYGPVGGEGAGA